MLGSFLVVAPHLEPRELDKIHEWSHAVTGPEVLQRLQNERQRRGIAVPSLRTVQQAMAGTTFRRGRKEARGRKPKLTKQNARKLNTTRKTLIKAAKGEREVRWGEIIRKSRVPTVDPTTAVRALRKAGIDVAARKPREEPMRSREHEEERVRLCAEWSKRPANFCTTSVHTIMDNKKLDIPTSAVGKRYSNMKKVCFHSRVKDRLHQA